MKPDSGFFSAVRGKGRELVRRTGERFHKSLLYPYYLGKENRIFHEASIASSYDPVEYELTGTFHGNYLVGTHSGILLVNKDGVYRLFGGSTYGITRRGDTFFAEQTMVAFSRVISFELSLDGAVPQYKNLRIVSFLKTRKIHQIDRFEKFLYLCDTYENRLLVMNLKTRWARKIYPAGKLKNGRSSSNYCHFNSVFVVGDVVYLLAHNETVKTGKKSTIYCLDKKSLEVLDIIETSGTNAHNIVFYQGEIMYCDSMKGAIIHGEKVLFQDERYMARGLSVTDDYIVVGGSEFAKREKRSAINGIMFFLNKKGECVSTIELGEIGGLKEIRHFGNDYALSENASVS